MSYSILNSNGQTTIPKVVRKSLQMLPGDRLEYIVQGDHAIIRIQPSTRSLKGALA